MVMWLCRRVTLGKAVSLQKLQKITVALLLTLNRFCNGCFEDKEVYYQCGSYSGAGCCVCFVSGRRIGLSVSRDLFSRLTFFLVIEIRSYFFKTYFLMNIYIVSDKLMRTNILQSISFLAKHESNKIDQFVQSGNVSRSKAATLTALAFYVPFLFTLPLLNLLM